MDREQLTNLLEAIRSVWAGVFHMEQELLSALSAEQVRRDAPASRGGNTPDEWFTLPELGEWLKVSRTTAYRLVSSNELPGYRIGRAIRVRRMDIEKWLME